MLPFHSNSNSESMHIVLVGCLLIVSSAVFVEASIGSEIVESLQRLIRSDCLCGEHECCSKWGYCGKTDEYCGEGCRAGPCKRASTTFEITSDLFDCVFPRLNETLRACRFTGLAEAMAEMKWKPENAIEAAIFLAHVAHETDGLRTLVEYCSKDGTCNNYQSSWCSIQANSTVQYYGRGWFQLSYPCNYYHAGKALGMDLLSSPELVSQSEKVAAATAIWYHKETGMNELARKGEFRETTRKLNEYECKGKAGYHLQAARVKTYRRVRQCFALPETKENLVC